MFQESEAANSCKRLFRLGFESGEEPRDAIEVLSFFCLRLMHPPPAPYLSEAAAETPSPDVLGVYHNAITTQSSSEEHSMGTFI